jgi:hypothetical protein
MNQCHHYYETVNKLFNIPVVTLRSGSHNRILSNHPGGSCMEMEKVRALIFHFFAGLLVDD